VFFIVFQFLVIVLFFAIMKIYLLHRLDLPKHTNLWWHEGPLNYQKTCSKGHSIIYSKQYKAVPKGAQRKLSKLTAKNKR
jgi:hypothetical protein